MFAGQTLLITNCSALQGFYLGSRIKVITKRDDCPYVTEISISKVKGKTIV